VKNQKHYPGQSLIEFVLVFPILFFLITGFLDLGRAVFYYSSLSNAVREGTRYTIVHKGLDEDAIKNKVLEYAFALKDTPNPLVADDIIFPPVDDPNTISIQATYTFKPITPGLTKLFVQLFGNEPGIDLVAQSTMRISGVYR